MSQHHSRAEKTEAHLRKPGKTGSSGKHRNFSGGGKGGGGGGGSPAPALSASAAPPPPLAPLTLAANRSVKKSDNGQEGRSRGSTVSSNSDAAHRTGHDGTYSTVLSNGNTSGAFLQFGTINPGIVNGIQIPARTTSAPPNLDEQNRDQGCHDSFRDLPKLPIPSVPKPQQQQKQENQQPRDFESVSKPNNGETHFPMQAKRGMPMAVPFQQSQIHFQFNSPNPPMPSQNVVASSLQMTMALPAGNVAQVPRQMFASNIPSHPLQPPAIMHQGQGLGFPPQLGHQVPPQLGSMGVGIAPQFPQQQPGHFSTQKRAVKITHPDTHEELKLDKRTDSHTDAGSSGQRQLQNASSQSQSLLAFNPPHQINYYKAPYNPSQMFFPPPSLHLTNTQMPTGVQSARYGYPVSQNGQTITFMNPSSLNQAISTSSSAPVQVTIKPANAPTSEKTGKSSVRVSLPATRSEQPKLSTLPGDASSVPHQKSGKNDLESSFVIQKPNSELSRIVPPFAIDEASTTVSSTVSTQMNETEASSSLHSATVEDSLSVMVENDCRKNEPKQILESIVDHQKVSNKREPRLPQQQQVIIGANNGNGTAKSVPNNCASIPSAPTVDSPTSNPRFMLSADVEYRNSESVSKTDVMRTSSPVFSLENADQGYHHAEIELHKLSLKEAGNPQTSICSNLNATGIVSETPSSVLDGRMAVEFGQIRGGEISDDVLSGSNSARESAVSTGSSQEMPEAVSHGVKEQAPEKIISAELDASKGINSEVERTRFLSMPSTSPYNNKDLSKKIDVNEFAAPPSDMSSMPSVFSEIEQNVKVEAVDQSHGIARMISESKGKSEPTKAKTNRKKKIKEILFKADVAGASDLYNAYKTPDEKHDATISTSEADSRCSTAELKNDASQDCSKVSSAVEEDGQDKAEVQDWEEAADKSIPRLRTPNNDVEKKNQIDEGNRSAGKKKYSRDFLLTFSHQCNDLPEGFEIGPGIADVVMCTSVGPGRLIDRSPRASRADKHISGISDDDKWARGSNAIHMDLNHGAGVLRNPRVQPPTHFANGILLSGSMQSLVSQGGMARSVLDIDRWKNANGTQRGLFPSPQGPMEAMHKSSNRYVVGKSSDEEEQKQRRVKAILNKLTPQNFEKLFSQVKDVRIDNTLTLSGVISQIFDKALIEPTFCEMYADFCLQLANELPNFFENNETITFRRLLVNKCQEEFERGEREQAEANKAEEVGEICQTEQEREQKRIMALRRMLGNIRLIGELYKKKMLTERIMHECIQKLLGCYQNPDEEDIESLCKLMSTIGVLIDHSKAKELMDAYFVRMTMLSTNEKLSSRVRFMLKDTIDLRKNKWQQRRKVEGPKKIEDVHKDAAQERQAQNSRLPRGPGVSSRWGQPVNFGHRGTTVLSSPSSQANTNFHGLPTQARGFISRDVRHEDRQMLVPLPQRSPDDGSITLGPQGGLAKGMSKRGLGLMLNVPSVEKSSRAGDSHRLVSGSNVFTPASDRKVSTSRESLSGASNDEISLQVRNSHLGVRDSHAAGERPVSSGGEVREASEAKAFSEDTLREKSISAIREFYSAKDEEEVVSCIKDLNAPYFYPSMVSLWVTDSFERKFFERNLLAELLVNLSRPRDALITRSQLIAGFESVLSSLEDSVNDAPKAAEFLGHIFGIVVVGNVLPLKEIGRMILEGGEEPGSLIEFGLASEVLFGILEFIKTEKGDSFLNEIRRGSDLRPEDFRPPKPTPKSKRLDAFL